MAEDWDALPAHVVRAIHRALDEATVMSVDGDELVDLVVDGVAWVLTEDEYQAIGEDALRRAVEEIRRVRT